MKESKSKVVEKLFATIKECEVFQDITGLEYKDEPNGEIVVVSYMQNVYHIDKKEFDKQASTFSINVTADSNVAIIEDVMRRLCEEFC